MRVFLGFLLLCAFPVAGSACSRAVSETAFPALTEMVSAPMNPDLMNQVVFLDAALPRRISIELTPRARRNRDGNLQVLIVLRNRSGLSAFLEARAIFFNARYIPSDGPTEWKTVVLPPHTTRVYEDYSSKTAEAAYYRVEIRERLP